MFRTKTKLIATVALLTTVGSLLFFSNHAQAIKKLDVSAYILNNKNKEIPNGEYDIRFAIYTTDRTKTDGYPSNADAGARVWEETQKVKIENGSIGAFLGEETPLPADLNFSENDYYIGIRINTDSEMVPRKKIGAVPLASDSYSVGGATLGTAEGNIVQLAKGGKIDAKILPSITTLGVIATGTWEGDAVTTNFGGTGLTTYTVGDTLFASAANTLSNLKIGTNGQVLSVINGLPAWGDLISSQNISNTDDALVIADSNADGIGDVFIKIADVKRMVILNNGNVGIGVDNPAYALDVAGTINARSLIINGEATLGTSGENVTINSNLIPSTTGLNLGSATNHWSSLYVDNMSVGGTDLNGTTSEYFAINTDSTVDETMGLRFYRSSLNGYAALVWDATLSQFNLFQRENTEELGDLNVKNIYAEGNVGIGTSTPSANLHIQGKEGVSQSVFKISQPATLGGGDVFTIAPRGRAVFTNNAQGAALTINQNISNTALELSTVASGSSGIYLYQSGVTTGNALSLSQTTSAFSGDGINMNFANGSGSFSGDFLDFNVNSVNKFKLDASGNGYFAGNLGIGTSSPNNFLQVAGLINFNNSLYSTSLGYQAGNANAGIHNSFVGYQAGALNTTGQDNIAVGYQALYSNTGGYNIAIGTGTLYSNTASNNIAVGYQTLNRNTAGQNNVAVGYQSMMYNIDGWSNSAFGMRALRYNTAGGYNSAFGVYAIYSNTTGSYNSAVGVDALRGNTTGNSNVGVGNGAGFQNSVGSGNIFVGYNAGYNELGSNKLYIDNSNTALPLIYGDFSTDALTINGTVGISGASTAGAKLTINGRVSQTGLGRSTYFGEDAGKVDDLTNNDNTGIGYLALFSNTTGGYNSALGNQALRANIAGFYNSALGNSALFSNTTGSYNSAFGPLALYSNTTGSYNSAMGNMALYSNTSGNSNIAIGLYALISNTTGSNNYAIGQETLRNISTNSNNIGFGYQAGYSALGSGNIFLGYQAGYSETGSDKLYIDNSNTATPLIYGDFSTNILAVNGSLGIGTTTPNNLLQVAGLINFDSAKNSTLIGAGASVNNTGNYNTALGVYVLGPNNTGMMNTAIGSYTLYANTSGAYNVAVGSEALRMNVLGSSNVAIGPYSLRNTIADNNSAMGYQSGFSITTGTYNTFLGNSAGNNASQKVDATNSMALGNGAYTTASNQVVLGNASVVETILRGNVGIGTTNPAYKLDIGGGDLNLAQNQYVRLGGAALFTHDGNSTSGTLSMGSANSINMRFNAGATDRMYIQASSGNVGIGTTTPGAKLEISSTTDNPIRLRKTTGGWNYIEFYNNTARQGYFGIDNSNNFLFAPELGGNIIVSNSSGTALLTVVNATGNIGIGTTTPNNSLQVSGLINFDDARFSTFLGYQAGNVNTGNWNTFTGYQAGNSNTTGGVNTANGYRALRFNTTGQENTANGGQALYTNTTGLQNTANGMNALYVNTTGSYNTANGRHTLFSNTTGSFNTANGVDTLYSNIIGNYNTGVGYQAGYSVLGSGNIFIGYKSGYSETGSNKLYIDNSNTASPLIYGDFSTDIVAFNGSVGIGTATPTSLLQVDGNGGYVSAMINSAAGQSRDLMFSSGGLSRWIIRANSVAESGSDVGTNLEFVSRTDAGALKSTVMTLLRTNGYVGIGTTAPAYKLEVAGSGLGDQFQITKFGNDGNASYGSWLKTRGTTAGSMVTTQDGDYLGIFQFGGVTSVNTFGQAARIIVQQDGTAGSTFYNPANMQFRVSSNTAEITAMTIKPTGNVGIGTTAPESKLHVISGASEIITLERATAITNSVASALFVRHTTSGDMVDGFGSSLTFQIKDSAGVANAVGSIQALRVGADNTSSLLLNSYSAGTPVEGMRITSNGRIGMGVTVPAEKLDILGNIKLSSTYPALRFKPTAWTENADFQVGINDSFTLEGAYAGFYIPANKGFLVSRGTNSHNFIVNSTTGYVGIGTNSPVGELHVTSSDTVSADRGITSSQHASSVHSALLNLRKSRGTILSPSTLANGDYIGSVGFFGYGTAYTQRATIFAIVNGTVVADSVPTDLVFRTGSTVVAEQMRITSAGNIGIGTSNPTAKLDVVGQTTSSDGFIQKTNAGACTDLTFTTATDGLTCLDTTLGTERLYFRTGGTWSYIAKTGGFQIPNYEVAPLNQLSKNTLKGVTPNELTHFQNYLTQQITPGELLIPYADSTLQDGAIHGLYARFADVKDQMFQEQISQIENLNLQVTGNITTVAELKNSVNTQFGSIEKSLSEITNNQDTSTKQISNINDQINAQTQNIASLQTITETLQQQITTLQSQIATPVNIAQIDANTQSIDYLNQLLGITDTSKAGDITIVGKLTSQITETGSIIITVDPKNKDKATIGEATIKAGDTSVTVNTKAVSGDSKVFVTSMIVTDQPLAVTKINAGEGFIVKIKIPSVEDLKFNWWLVDSK
ncbi:MAG: hypothetical protein Q7T51_01855 [Candidatus Moranbacteria bacterium]|nr:hypothetical protein [Candidatus Moranbacteria bacterium]